MKLQHARVGIWCFFIRVWTRLVRVFLRTQEGKVFPSPQNRLSLGSRGDSFYEYLLKDALFSAESAAEALNASRVEELCQWTIQHFRRVLTLPCLKQLSDGANFSDQAEDPLTKKLWSAFRAKLPGLFAEGRPPVPWHHGRNQ